MGLFDRAFAQLRSALNKGMDVSVTLSNYERGLPENQAFSVHIHVPNLQATPQFDNFLKAVYMRPYGQQTPVRGLLFRREGQGCP